MATSRTKEDRTSRRPLRLMIIKPQDEQVSSAPPGHHYIVRPDLVSDEREEFTAYPTHVISNLAEDMRFTQAAEPGRLFEAKEYRATVIAAMNLLEATLRRRLDKAPWNEARRRIHSAASFLDRSGHSTRVEAADLQLGEGKE